MTEGHSYLVCKGLCARYKTSSRYAGGAKRRNVCEIFIKYDSYMCPCCHYALRTAPRLGKARLKLLELKKMATVIAK